ncbi:MAG: hypothetical protein RTU30_14385, partial [Candidatus Thorarchaeota archaeon]
MTFFDAGFEYQYWHPDGYFEFGHSWGQMALIYWSANNTFDYRLAHTLWLPTGDWDPYRGEWIFEDVTFYEPWPLDVSFPMPFVLNMTTSEYSLVEVDKHSVTFRGHVSEDMAPTGMDGSMPLQVHESVYSTAGQRLIPFVYLPLATEEQRAEYEALRQLTIESPVAVVELLHKGEPYDPSWMFVVDHDDTFVVRSYLQGGASLASDIDGVALILFSHDERWGHDAGYDWQQFSEVEVFLGVSPDGGTDVKVYNRTVRTAWKFGGNWQWEYVEIFPGSGLFEWQEIWIDDWQWIEQTWDFTLGDWTDKFVSFNSPETLMPVTVATISNVSYKAIGNDLRASFDVTITPQMPELEWQWDFFFANLTWVTDYEAGWGEHTIVGWLEQPVYSYMNSTDRIYVETPYRGKVMRNNDTDVLYAADSSPFIFIDGRKEYVKTIVQDNTGVETELILFEEWDKNAFDPHTGQYTGYWVYSYRLQNGTTIPITEGKKALIFNITTWDGKTFQALDDMPRTAYWLPGDYQFFVATNGTYIVRDRTYWDMGFMPMFDDMSKADKVGLFSLANNTIPIFMANEPIWLGDHYMFHVNGTWEEIHVWWGHNPDVGGDFYFYHNMTDGATYWFYQDLWPMKMYEASHRGAKILVPEPFAYFYPYWDDGGKDQQLPLPDPMLRMMDIYELNFMTPREHRVQIDGTFYPVMDMGSYWENNLGYFYPFYTANVSGTIYNLTQFGLNPIEPWNPMGPQDFPFVTTANGSIYIPILQHHDWTVAYGHRDPWTWEFIVEGWLDLTTGFYNGDYGSSAIYDTNMTYFYDFAKTFDGFQLNYTQLERVFLYNVTLANGTYFYTGYPELNEYAVYNMSTGTYEIFYYYMYDIEGVRKTWTKYMEFSVELAIPQMYDQISDPHRFQLEGTWYNVTKYDNLYWDVESQQPFSRMEWNVELDWFDALTNGTHTFEIVPLMDDWDMRYNFPSFEFTLDDVVWYNITASSDLIYKAHNVWGYSQKLDYVPLPISTLRNQGPIVVGAPMWGMWDVMSWDIDQRNGALDLDGNFATTDDQYYIQKAFESTDTYNITEEFLQVSILWEPNSTTFGDEFYLTSYTGMHTVNWTSSWSDNFYWYDADTGELIGAAEWAIVYDTLFNPDGSPRPGYWDIAWMADNFTSDDLKQQAIDEGWDWVDPTSQSWSWIWWELSEHYGTEWMNDTTPEYMSVDVWYEYAGMFAWNDTDSNSIMDMDPSNLGTSEVTHFWLPTQVDAVSFLTPNATAVGDEYWAYNMSVPFGVTFTNVTGTVFPFGDTSYFDWYQGQYTGSDFGSFEERPADAEVDEFTIGVEFSGNVTSEDNNEGSVKFNMTVGEWTVDAPGGRSVLDGRSMGIAFYSDVSLTSASGEPVTAFYEDDYGLPINGTSTQSSSNYTMSFGPADVASMNMGGAPYTWSKNASASYTVVDSQTIPADAFMAAYISEGGETATGFQVSSDQFYTLINFRWWDGYKVSVDPVFVGYSSSRGVTDDEVPSLDSVNEEVQFVNDKERLYFEVEASDTGGSGVAEVRVMDTDTNENTTLEYNGDTELWTGSIVFNDAWTPPHDFHYTVVVLDFVGNEDDNGAQTHTFYNDNTSPTISDISASEIDWNQNSITISATVSDAGGAGIDYVNVYLINTAQTVAMSYNGTTGKYEADAVRTSSLAYTLQY